MSIIRAFKWFFLRGGGDQAFYWKKWSIKVEHFMHWLIEIPIPPPPPTPG